AEVGQVAAAEVGVEPELGGAGDQLLGAEVAAEGVHRLGEVLPGPLEVALGPEQAEQLLAAAAPLAGGGEEGEEGETPPLRPRALGGGALPLDAEPAEGDQPEGRRHPGAPRRA